MKGSLMITGAKPVYSLESLTEKSLELENFLKESNVIPENACLLPSLKSFWTLQYVNFTTNILSIPIDRPWEIEPKIKEFYGINCKITFSIYYYTITITFGA